MAGILKQGGTILGTTNKGHFAAKVGEGNVAEIPGDHRQGQDHPQAARNPRPHRRWWRWFPHHRHAADANGIPVVGVPKTIDNDLAATAMTFGFDSAVSTVVDALDRLHTTADSHKRVMVVEVMGRNAGWIAL